MPSQKGTFFYAVTVQRGPLLIWLIKVDFVDKFSTSPHTSELYGQFSTPVPSLDMLSFVSSEEPLSPIMVKVNSPLADAADYSWFCLSVLPLLIHLVFMVKFPTPIHHSFASYRKAPFSHCQLADVVETENRIFTSKHQDLYFYNFLRTLSCSISQAHFSPFSADVLLPIAPEIDFCPRGRAATTTICPEILLLRLLTQEVLLPQLPSNVKAVSWTILQLAQQVPRGMRTNLVNSTRASLRTISDIM